MDRLAASSSAWPVLRSYAGDQLSRIAMPLGGIGTGTVSLGGRGNLRDWEIMNRPAKGYVPNNPTAPMAAIWWGDSPAGPSGSRLLEGPLPAEAYEGARGSSAANHGLPRFRAAGFDSAYPFARVHLLDEDLPFAVHLEAMNPLIPGDSEASGLPLASLRYVVSNRSSAPLPLAICLSLPNPIGADGRQRRMGWGDRDEVIGWQDNQNETRYDGGLTGILLRSAGVPTDDEAWGSIALAVPADIGETSHRLHWRRGGWGRPLLDFWQDFTADGRLDPVIGETCDPPAASLALRCEVAPEASVALPFLLGWHFPNRKTWDGDGPIVGNYYARNRADAWAVLTDHWRSLPELETQSRTFVNSLLASDLPDVLQEAVLANLSTLRSQTCFRTEDGRFFGWEGCSDRSGCCSGSCTHVWNYELATPSLFPDLARDMRQTEFEHCTDHEGRMNFRVKLPLSENATLTPEQRLAAADGQMGCIVRAYREWRQSGDDAWLAGLWPQIKAALGFAWVPGGWDADRDGVMEGCQHNTMDVEYLGPNPQMGSWYLAALRATAVMAAHFGEMDLAADCDRLAARGRAFLDTELFNGSWYEHRIEPIPDPLAIARGLTIGMTDASTAEPELQLGPGCLIDQLVGQYLAHACDLGYLLDPANVKTALTSILQHNRRSGFHSHFNNMRSFVLGDEEAVLMVTYPHGLPERPSPYHSEAMTGFEHMLAVQLLQEGFDEEALRVVAAIRARYDGRKRNPFDEAECGHHYVRAMASWGYVHAWYGFHYDGVDQRISIAARPGRYCWAAAGSWGELLLDESHVHIRIRRGLLAVERVLVAGTEWPFTLAQATPAR